MDRTSTAPKVLGHSRIGTDAARIALTERDDAWRLAAYAIGRARAGQGSTLMFEGPPGLGKSALMAAIQALARASGTYVATAAGRRGEEEFGFGVMIELTESVLDPGRSNGGEPWVPELRGSEPSFDRLDRLYRFCTRLAAVSPLTIVIDDVDLADEASLRFLLYLAERLAGVPIALVVARGRLVPRRAPQLLGDLARHHVTTRHRLAPLTRTGTARTLAKTRALALPDEVADEVHRLTGGNPFLVDALGAAMGGSHTDDMPRLRGLVPSGVAEWASGLAAGVDSRAPALLRAIAVLGPECELRHAAAVAKLDAESAAEIADALCEIGLVAGRDRFSVAQPVVSSAVVSALGREGRAALNLAAARMLAAEEAPPEQVAAHILDAPRRGSEWAVRAVRAGAARALARGAPDAAVRYLRRAVEEPPVPDKRAQVNLELGRVEAMAGEPQAAARLEDAAEQLTPASAARAAMEAGRAMFALGRFEEAWRVFDRGLERGVETDPDVAHQLSAGVTTARWLTQLVHRGRRRLGEAPAEGNSPGDRALLALHAMEAAMRGAACVDVRALAERALAQGALLDEDTADGLSYYLAAGALVYAEDLQLAEAALTAAVHDAQSRGSVLGLANASHVRALAILMRGRLRDAEEDAWYALAVERHGWRFGVTGARAVLATTHLERGDLEGARRHVAAAESGTGEEDPFRLWLLGARGRLKLASGDAEGAAKSFLESGELAEQMGAPNPAVSPWRSRAGRALAATGDASEGARLVEAELALARAFGAPGAIGRALRALGAVRKREPGLEALEAAVETLRGSQTALERAAALVDFGAALRRSGRRRDSRSPLSEGLDLAQRCGADAVVARAAHEIKLAGARPRRTALSGPDSLTTREREVVSLAAEGLSNREIAERLVVTVKTVEWHLRLGYRKLGIKSRSELGVHHTRGD